MASFEELRRGALIADDAVWNGVRTSDGLQSGKPFALRLCSEGSAVSVETIEEERRQRHIRSKAIDIQPASKPAHRFLKRQWRSVALQRQHLAIENDLACRQRHDRLDDLGHGGCHITERAREYAHLVTGLVHLDAGAIELQLERRLDRTPSGLQPRFPRAMQASAQPDGIAGLRISIAPTLLREGPRTPRRQDLRTSSPPGERPPAVRLPLWPRLRRVHLPARPGAARPTAGARESPVRCSWRGRNRSDNTLRADARRSRTLRARNSIECVVSFAEAQAGFHRGSDGARLRHEGPADTNAPLRKRTRKKRDGKAHFLGCSSLQQLGQFADLVQTPSRSRDGIRHVDQFLQLHPSMLQRQFRDALCSGLFALSAKGG